MEGTQKNRRILHLFLNLSANFADLATLVSLDGDTGA